jgi:hypothetical protein
MFLFFGLGAQEILILLIIGLFVVGVPALAVVLILVLTRRNQPPLDDGRPSLPPEPTQAPPE